MSINIKNLWMVIGDLREDELEEGLNKADQDGFKIHKICDCYRAESNDLRFTIIARKQTQERRPQLAGLGQTFIVE